jgi:hypothetical protein
MVAPMWPRSDADVGPLGVEEGGPDNPVGAISYSIKAQGSIGTTPYSGWGQVSE